MVWRHRLTSSSIVSHTRKGELLADYCEVYTGTELSGCVELRKAIEHCKKEDAVLIIAKTDRFRNTIEALQIYEEMGDGHIMFCDLPHTDKFTLTLFFALAEREHSWYPFVPEPPSQRKRPDTSQRGARTNCGARLLTRAVRKPSTPPRQRLWRQRKKEPGRTRAMWLSRTL